MGTREFPDLFPLTKSHVQKSLTGSPNRPLAAAGAGRPETCRSQQALVLSATLFEDGDPATDPATVPCPPRGPLRGLRLAHSPRAAVPQAPRTESRPPAGKGLLAQALIPLQ